MKNLGRHVLAEFGECDPVLDNVELIKNAMVNAALEAGAEVREVTFHQFSPQGVSGVVIISESHVTIHTWPELGYAAVDAFTCGERVDPANIICKLQEILRPKVWETSTYTRGVPGMRFCNSA